MGGIPAVTGLFQRHDHLAVDVKLRLAGRGVADPNGGGPGEAAQPRELGLREEPLAPDSVHDLDLAGIPVGGAQHPRAKRRPFGRVAGMLECAQGQGGVPQPGVPVVPVAPAADPLGKRRGRRGDDPARGRIS